MEKKCPPDVASGRNPVAHLSDEHEQMDLRESTDTDLLKQPDSPPVRQKKRPYGDVRPPRLDDYDKGPDAIPKDVSRKSPANDLRKPTNSPSPPLRRKPQPQHWIWNFPGKVYDKIDRRVIKPGFRRFCELRKLRESAGEGNPTGNGVAVTVATPSEFPFSDNLQNDMTNGNFEAICEKICEHLLAINQHYTKGTRTTELMVTLYQLVSKEVSISVFGRHNTGKSTLLNTLAGGRFLPVKVLNETSFKVKVFHDKEVHKGPCKMAQEACAECAESRCLNGECPRLFEDTELPTGCTLHTTYGEKKIYSRLEEMNMKVRTEQAADTLPEFELYVNAPVLSGVPPGWRVCLVDNPGFGEAKQHVTQLAEKAMKISSAYIYLLTTKSLGDTVDAEAFRNLAERDREAFDDGRFIAVITHFDENYCTDDPTNVKECEIKKCVITSISDATKVGSPINIDKGSVIAMSSNWAFTAKQLKTMDRTDPLYQSTLKLARKALEKYPHLECPRGEGIRLKDHLKKDPDKVPALLLDASGVKELQYKIEGMTKCCMKVWARKMSSDCHAFMRDAKETVTSKLIDLKKDIKEKSDFYNRDLKLYKSIESGMKALELPAKPEDSPVWQAIDAAYPTDIESSNLKVVGKEKVKKLVEAFEKKIRGQIEVKQLTAPTFQDSLDRFLEEAARDLDKTFNDTCAFSSAQEALRDSSMNMMDAVGKIRTDVHVLLEIHTSSQQAAEQSVRDTQSRTKRQIFDAPNLGKVKEGVKIPSISFSFWERLVHFILRHILVHDATLKEELETNIKRAQEKLEYRSWTKDHDEMMSLLRQSLEEQCRIYLDGIRPNAVEYFFRKYMEEVKWELLKLHCCFELQLQAKKTTLHEMNMEIEKQKRETAALQATIEYLARLEDTLRNKTEEYMHLL